MIRKLALAAGFGAGYVLGSKAGRQRYEQIVTTFRQVAGMPAVREVRSSLGDAAGQLGERAKETVNEKVAAVAEKIPDMGDLGRSAGAASTTRTPAGPRPGTAKETAVHVGPEA